MSTPLPILLGVALLTVVVLTVAGIRRCWDACQARRARRARALARHPAQLARRPLRRRVPGLPVDGEPLDDDDLDEFTGVMIASGYDGWRGNQAQDTGADEGAE